MKHEPKHNLSAEEEVGIIVTKSELFIERHKKTIGGVILAIILLIGAFFAYKYMYAMPREKEATDSIFRAEHYFAIDSFNIALNGDGDKTVGFLEIIDKYGSTKAGNLAQAYSGICYFNLGQTEKALEHLKKFNAKDQMVSPAIVGLIGDCYVQMDKTNEAVSYFKKAAKVADNDLLSPVYLKKAGLAYEALGQYSNALECYQMIKDKYYNSYEATAIEKYIERIHLKDEAN